MHGAFGVKFKKFFLSARQWRFPFFPKRFIVLYFGFKSMAHFSSFLYKVWGLWWGSFFYLYSQWIQHYLLKNLSFFHWIAFAPLSKINWAHLWIFQTVVLEKTLESPLDSKEVKPVNPKGNQSWIFTVRIDAKAESTLTTWCEELTHWKRLWCWERLRARGMWGAEDEMVGWHHQLNGHEFEQTQGDSEGQERLACCSPWGHRVRHELSDWTTTFGGVFLGSILFHCSVCSSTTITLSW